MVETIGKESKGASLLRIGLISADSSQQLESGGWEASKHDPHSVRKN